MSGFSHLEMSCLRVQPIVYTYWVKHWSQDIGQIGGFCDFA